jgi:predicted double-glycine peptidase
MTPGRLSVCLALFVGLMLAKPFAVFAGEVYLNLGGVRGHKTIRSLQEIRQAHTVRQRWDYSCGSAALATILTHHYHDKTSEAVIITSILRITDPVKIKARGGFSLLDLKRFLASRGYEGKGYAGLSLEELAGLKLPAVVPVRTRGYDHFVVFRGIRGNRVLLSDPAFGTVTMKSAQFVETWKGGVAFMVLRPGAPEPSDGLEPKPEDFLVPDGVAILRASTTRPTPLTRVGR